MDYAQKSIPRVTRIGATERDLSPDERFDLIVCNHVMEHVADPVDILATLSAHLSDDGFIYVEVPMEIWGQAPLQEEPVTHVNFFTPASLARCLYEAGIDAAFCKLGGYLPPSSGQMLLAVMAVGKRGEALPSSSRVSSSKALAQAKGFLSPGYREKLRRYRAMPSTIPAALAYKV
ncbi:MAG: Methyltransferase domain-containing protein [Candidatus Kentron sp. G]|nr:MAG: Methyltransferase domain-containing protein [Candidatus Kentron sp. G]VFN07940.1 MAG: Methyltransferase domain-containing protein [Candidatus Kentron sp. G]